MGVYKITNITHSGRPVWQSTVRKDRYLFYNGNNMIITKLIIYLNISGDWSQWVVNDEVSNGRARIKSKKKSLVFLPVSGWQYRGGGGWNDDDTLTVTGKYISCLILI